MNALIVYGAGLAVCSIVLFFPSERAPASEVETRSYLEVIQRICVSGVTLEAIRAHEQVVAALAKEGKVTDTAGGTVAPVSPASHPDRAEQPSRLDDDQLLGRATAGARVRGVFSDP